MAESESKKAILITGASTGIGKASAIDLSKDFLVFAGVRKSEDEDAIRNLNNSNLIPVRLDVTDSESRLSAKNEIEKHLNGRPLYGLINNAGIAVGGPIETLPLNRFREQFEVNVFGALATTQMFLPAIRQSKGRVVNISSVSGLMTSPFMGPYCSSKFALEALSDALRRELMQYGVNVSVIEPGPIKTPIWEKSLARKEEFMEGCSEEARTLYEPMLVKFLESIDKVAKSAVEVDVVVEKMRHAMTSKKPKTRYLVGPQSSFVGIMRRFGPDRLMDKLMVSQIKKGKPARQI